MNRLTTTAIAILLSATCLACRYEVYLWKADTDNDTLKIQAEALTSVAVGYTQLENENQSDKILDKAQEIAKKISIKNDIDKKIQAEALTSVAVGYAQLGNQNQSEKILNQALKLTKTIEIYLNNEQTNQLKSDILRDVLVRYAEAQQYTQFINILKDAEAADKYQTLENQPSRSSPFFEIALEAAEKRQYDRAFEIFNLIQGSSFECDYCITESLSEIVNEVTQTEPKTQALQILDRTLEVSKTLQGEDLIKVLNEVAIGYSKLGQRDRALQVLDQALEATKSIRPVNVSDADNDRAAYLNEIALKYKEWGQTSKALEVLDRAFEVANNIQPVDISSRYLISAEKSKIAARYQYHRAYNLSEIAGSYGKLGQSERALQILDRSFEVAKTIENDDLKAYSLSNIANNYAKLGQTAKGLQVLDQALRIVKSTSADKYSNSPKIFIGKFHNWVELKPYTLAKVALGYSKLGQTDKAFHTFNETLKNIRDEDTLSAIALTYLKEGQNDQVIKIANTSFKTIHPYFKQDPNDKHRALIKVAKAAAEMGQYDLALETIDTIPNRNYNLENGLSVQAGSSKARGLQQIAIAATEAKKYDFALEIINSIDDYFYRSIDIIDDLNKIANRATQTEPKANALSILAKVQKSAETRINNDQKAFVLTAIASNYAQLRQTKKAEKLLEQAVRIVQNMDRYRIWFNSEGQG